MISFPVLRPPNFDKKFTLSTDASGFALGATLGQFDDMGNEYVVAYASRLLKGSELHYGITKKECLAVVWAIRTFRPYLHNVEFDCITDHSALQWLLKAKDLINTCARWALYLGLFRFNIIHRKGSKHCNADALSRPVVNNISIDTVETNEDTLDESDPHENEPLIHFLKFGKHINGATRKQVNRINRLGLHYKLDNGEIKFTKNLNNPVFLTYPHRNEREKIIIDAHQTGGHFMAQSTYDKIKEKYFWKNMKEQIIRTTNKCLVCLRNNSTKIWNHPARAIEINGLHDRIHIDLHFGLNKTKDGYIGNMVIVEALSDWTWATLIRSKEMSKWSKNFWNT